MIVDNLGKLWYNESEYGSIRLVIFREEVALCISLMTLIILQINRVDAMIIVGVIVGDATPALVTIIPKETLNNSSAAEQRISPPAVQFEKWKRHPVFPHFSNFRLWQNLLLSALASLFRASLMNRNQRTKAFTRGSFRFL